MQCFPSTRPSATNPFFRPHNTSIVLTACIYIYVILSRQKMYVHERMACSYTSMLRYQTCAVLPVMVGEWSLAIDNCMPWLDSK